MGDHTAFFYGTLMAPGVLYRVIYGSHTPEEWQKKLTHFQPALLQDYSRHRVRNADFPAVTPRPASSVRGTYVTGLTEGDLFRLDIFEGEMYQRKKVKVKILKDEVGLDRMIDESKLDEIVVNEVEVETYVWSDPLSDLEEEEWDFEQFKKEKMYAWMGVSGYENSEVQIDDGFADVDEAVKAEAQKVNNAGQRDNGLKVDPSGGRINGQIARDLANAAL